MTFRPFYVVLLLALYLPFEEFLLKWLPVSDRLYSYSRLGSELILYSLLFVVVLDRLLHGLSLRRSPLDGWLVGFCSLALLSVYWNGAPWLGSLINFRTLVRYIAVYFVLVQIDFTREESQGLMRAMVGVAVLETLLAGWQHLTGMGMDGFWLPRATDLEIGGYRKTFTVLEEGVEQGVAFGTFAHTVSMALYLVICEVLLLSGLFSRRGRPAGASGPLFAGAAMLLATGILVSYSRSSLLILLLALPCVLYCAGRRRAMAASLAVMMLVAILAAGLACHDGRSRVRFLPEKVYRLGPFENYGIVFTREFFSRLQHSRLWVLNTVGRSVLETGTPIGFGPDEPTAKAAVVKRAQTDLSRLIAYKAFEDVYWVALLTYYGVVGVAVFSIILLRLLRGAMKVASESPDPDAVRLGVAVATLVMITLVLSFLVRTFEFRTFGFYFWLLAGLVMNEHVRMQSLAEGSHAASPDSRHQ